MKNPKYGNFGVSRMSLMIACLLLISQFGFAQENRKPRAPSNLRIVDDSGYLPEKGHEGRLWASQCFQCHGTNGQAVGDIDSIVGKNPNSIIEELEEMKERSTVEGIMDLHARGYTDTQIRAIAQYLSTLPGD